MDKNKVDYKSMIRISIPISWDSESEEMKEVENKERCIYCYKIILDSTTITGHESVCIDAKRCTLPRVICKSGTEKFICEFCYKTFKYLKSLIEHELRHEPPGGFICLNLNCEEKFCSDIELKWHEEVNHGIIQEFQIFQCNECGRKLKTAEILDFHKNSLNCGDIKPYPCRKCDKAFRTKYLLKSHELSIHLKCEEFCCTYCGDKFSSKGAIVRHERQHTGEKPYVCNICGKSFAHRESWVTHSSVHTGIKPYFCECCGLRFSCTSNLIAHRRKRPDTCGQPQYCKKLTKICPRPRVREPIVVKKKFKKFKKLISDSNRIEEAIPNINVDELIENRKIYIKEYKKYLCFDCKQIFNFKTSYVRHQKNIHKRTQEEIFDLIHPPEVREQMRETGGKPMYKCKYCHKSYTSPLYLDNHIKLHGDGSLIFGCRSCPTHFSTRADRNFHTSSVHNYNKKIEPKTEIEAHIKIEREEIGEIGETKMIKNNSLVSTPLRTRSIIQKNYKEESDMDSKYRKIRSLKKKKTDPVILSVNPNICEEDIKTEQSATIKEETSDLSDWNNDNDEEDYKAYNLMEKFLEVKYENEQNNSTDEDVPLQQLLISDINFHCDVCKKRFKTVKLLKQHINTHTSCTELTEDPLNKRKSFRNGRRKVKHSIPKGSTLDNLKEETYNSTMLTSDEKKFWCDQCQKSFGLKQSFVRHQKNVHGRPKKEISKIMHPTEGVSKNVNKPTYECKICNKKYYYIKFYEAHTKTHVSDSFISHDCGNCLKYFASKSKLVKHLKKCFSTDLKEMKKKDLSTEINENCTITIKTEKEQDQCILADEDQCILADEDQSGTDDDSNESIANYNENSQLATFLESPYNSTILTPDKKSFWCPECQKPFGLKQSFVRHQKNIHKRIKGEIYKIMHPSKFREHTDKPKYKCKFCKRKYTYLKGLESHIQAHGPNGSLIHQCQTCLKWFASKEEIKEHTKRDHKDEVTCILCNKMYTNSELLQTHIRYAHSEDPNKKPKKQIFCCGKCGKTMTSKTLLNNHEASDCGKNPIYKCPVCGTALNSKGSLKSHLQRHAGVKEFKCEHCGKEFATKSEHKVHQRIHTGEKPYSCTYCEKAFAYRENLLIHLSTHTGMKRYLCNTCGERFSCVSGIKAHWRTHSDTCGTNETSKKARATFFVGYRNGELKYTKE